MLKLNLRYIRSILKMELDGFMAALVLSLLSNTTTSLSALAYSNHSSAVQDWTHLKPDFKKKRF